VVSSLPFSRLLQLQRLLGKAKLDEAKDKLALAAFVGFQMGAAGKMTYGEYLRHLGLSDEPVGRAGPVSKAGGDARLARMGIVAKKVEDKSMKKGK